MFQKLLEKIAAEFEKRSIPYMVIGDQALLIYGEPRLTKDIDITLGFGPERLPEILKITEGFGWKSLADSPESFAHETMVLPCLDPKSGIRIDFIFSFSIYEKEALKRVRRIQLGKEKVRFASLEDFIIHKTIAGRPRDLEDVRTVLIKNKQIDDGYIQKWLKIFDKDLSRSFLKKFEEIKLSLRQ